MTAEALLFDTLAALAVFSAVAMVVVARTAVGAATALLACVTAIAGLLVLIGAELLGVVFWIVQAGAVTVLLLMIILLVGAEGGRRPASRLRDMFFKLVGCASAAGIALLIVHAVPTDLAPVAGHDLAASGGHRVMGLALFRDHLLPLQIVALLLTSAVVGSIALAGRRVD